MEVKDIKQPVNQHNSVDVMMKTAEKTLKGLKETHLLRSLRGIDSAQETRILFEGKQVLLFCSNNYLGLANHPKLKKAAIEAIEHWGVGTGASRLISGNLSLFKQVEKKLAALKSTESALVFNSGYTTNIGVIGNLVKKGDLILGDRLNHASLIDACRLSSATFRIYRHKDMMQLQRLLAARKSGQRILIVSDAVFSMDGDIAPLPDLIGLAERYDARIYLDDAHGTGVLGAYGGGTADHFQISSQRLIQMGTLSKALGGFGGFIAGDKMLIDTLINTSRPFIYTTALPPSVLATALAALEVIEKEAVLRDQLWKNRHYLSDQLQQLGFDTLESETPILPILIGDSKIAMAFSETLLENGIYVSAIRPPTVPEGGARLRITVMASHTFAQIDYLLEQLEKAGRNLGVI